VNAPTTTLYRAETLDQRCKAYNLRYELYVARQGLFGAVADHEHRWLRDQADDHATIWVAERDEQVIATARVFWGGAGRFDHETREVFDVDAFTDVIDESRIAIASRVLVHPDHRDPSLNMRLFADILATVVARGTELLLGECEPHLLNLWTRLGFRAYGMCEHPVNGTLVRIALVVADRAHATAVGSPFAAGFGEWGSSSAIPSLLAKRLANTQRVISEGKDAETFWAAIKEVISLEELGSKLGDLDAAELGIVLSKAHVLDCSPGCTLIRKGHVSRTLYILLSGSLAIVDGSRDIAHVTRPGEIIGEVALFSGSARISDVRTGAHGARVLALSERNICEMLAPRGGAAAKFLLALTRGLCNKLCERAQITTAA
jgi:CRP-like cAMP-binding protein/predicted GNAT family N-acyltransferase